MKIREGVDLFAETISIERNLCENTLKAYRSDLVQLDRMLTVKEVEEITPEDIREVIRNMDRQHHHKDSTIRRRIATMKVFFSFLEDEGIIHDSPTKRMRRRYGVVKHLPKVMSSSELVKLLKAVCREIQRAREARSTNFNGEVKSRDLSRACRDRVILEVLFSTGMRIGELVQIDTNDLDIRERTILILGKGGKERIAYISSDEVLDAIGEHLALRKCVTADTSALFLNKDNRRLSIFSVENIFKKYCKKAKIKNHYTPHCLRHTMATMLLSNGADIRSVQEILGHASIVTTQIYTEVSSAHKRKVLGKFHQRNRMNISL